MERIKKAIERARREREGSRQAAGARRRPASAPAVPAVNQAGERASADPGEIAYTDTRTIRVARDHMRRSRIISGFEPARSADAYAMLRTQVLQRMRQRSWSVLGVTSPRDGEGKTLTAINLAISTAQEVDHTVLLVDADLRRPSIQEYFGFDPAPGLVDHLTKNAPIAELLVHPEGIDRFVILPGGAPAVNSADLMDSQRMARLVEELRQRYPERIVVIDMPPILVAADASAVAPHVDAVLMVVEDGKTHDADVRQALAMMEVTNVLGTVLNKASRYSRYSAYT